VDDGSSLGVSQLGALADSDLLDESAQDFVDAALDVVLRDRTEDLDELDAAGEDADVIELPGTTDFGAASEAPAVPSEYEREGGGDD
jgi:hypothetical protein